MYNLSRVFWAGPLGGISWKEVMCLTSHVYDDIPQGREFWNLIQPPTTSSEGTLYSLHKHVLRQ